MQPQHTVLLLLASFLLPPASTQTKNEDVHATFKQYNLRDLSVTSSNGGVATGWVKKMEEEPRNMYWESCGSGSPRQETWLETTPISSDAQANLHVRIGYVTWCEEGRTGCDGSEIRLRITPRDRRTAAAAPIISSFPLRGTSRGSVLSTLLPFPEAEYTLSVNATSFSLAISDANLCIRVSELTVISKFCPDLVKNLTIYKRTAAPRLGEEREAEGSCVDNAASDFQRGALHSSAYCYQEGYWKSFYHTCICDPAFQPDPTYTKCTSCGPHTYKSEAGNHQCEPCPAHSDTLVSESKGCNCEAGRYRVDEEDFSGPCLAPPGPPLRLRAVPTETSVSVSWDGPDQRQNGVWYRVECSQCTGFFAHQRVSATNIQLTELQPSTTYNLTVYALPSQHHLPSHILPKSASTSFTTTYANVPQNIRVSSEAGRATVKWDAPYDFQGKHHIVSFKRDSNPSKSNPVPVTTRVTGIETTLPNLVAGQWYVRVALDEGRDPPIYSHWVGFTVAAGGGAAMSEEEQVKHLMLVVAMLAVVCGLFVFLCFGAFVMYRKQHAAYTHSHLGGGGGFYPGPFVSPDAFHGADPKLPLGQAFIEPSFYEDVNQMISEFSKVIDEGCLSVSEKTILTDHEGSMGEFHVGKMSIEGSGQTPVLVKSVSSSNHLDCRLLVVEACTMSQFYHPNIQLIHGVFCNENCWGMVLEMTEDLSLYGYLRRDWSDEPPNEKTTMHLLHMLRGIACGMQYLSDVGYVHKVLTSRNVKLTANLLCKISGFEQRAELEENAPISRAHIDVRDRVAPWCAPEVLVYGKFSCASDVWSFGTVMWEVLQCCPTCCNQSTNYLSPPLQPPYGSMTTTQIRDFVWSGYRLDVPAGCPSIFYKLMTDCWNADRNCRPLFAQITDVLEMLIRQPRLLETGTVLRQPPSPASSSAPLYQTIQPKSPLMGAFSVHNWLASQNLLKYRNLLLTHHITQLQDVLALDDVTLKQLGVSSKKDRRKMLHSVLALKSAASSSSCLASPDNQTRNFTCSPVHSII